MSRLYDTVEPSVVDEEMLQRAVEEQGPKEEAGKIAKNEGIDFKDVTNLRLDFKNILKIDNLWEFTNLTKLQLDNNIIEKIEGLDVLVNLVWLDLSFNNIEVIEGLDNCVKLEDLTLYNNRIARVENMDALTELQVFSIGNNQLTELDNLVYLRRFKKLKTLNLAGNPFCELESYRPHVVGFLSHLDFLDYRLIDPQSKLAAYERYSIAIEEILDNEKKAQIKDEEAAQAAKKLELHTKAYVENMDGPALFDAMYAEDAEGQKLNEMPGVDELIVSYREKFQAVCMDIFQYGLEEQEKRQEEVDQFWECVNEAKQENKEAGMRILEDFQADKKKFMMELQMVNDPKDLEQKVEDYQKHITNLWDKLMGLELQLVDQLEDVVKDFERNMQDLVSTFIENVQGFLTQARDLENMHHERLMEIAMLTLEKVIKNELEDEISEELRMLFVDKDTINNAVSTSHDVHLLKIDNKEDDMITRINNWLKTMIENIHEVEEVRRNRNRVSEINHLTDHLREELDSVDTFQGATY